MSKRVMGKAVPWILSAATLALGGWLGWRIRPPEPPAPTPAQIVAVAQRELQAGDAVAALRQLGKIPDRAKLAGVARRLEGDALQRLHRWRDAEAKWLAALQLDPNVGDAAHGLCDLYFATGRYAETRALVASLAPKIDDLAVAASLLLEAVRQEHERIAPPLTVQLVSNVAVRDPDDLAAKRTLARNLVEVGRVTEGLAVLQEVTERAPHDAELWAVRLQSSLDAGRLDEAEKLAAKLAPGVTVDPAVQLVLARLQEAGGDTQAAERTLRGLLAKGHVDRKAQALFAKVLKANGKTADATKAAEEAARLEAARESQASWYLRARKEQLFPGPATLRGLTQACSDYGWPDMADAFAKHGKRVEERTRMGGAFR